MILVLMLDGTHYARMNENSLFSVGDYFKLATAVDIASLCFTIHVYIYF